MANKNTYIWKEYHLKFCIDINQLMAYTKNEYVREGALQKVKLYKLCLINSHMLISLILSICNGVNSILN